MLIRQLLLAALPLFPWLALADDPAALEIIELAFQADDANEQIARQYTFHERTDARFLDRQGRLKRHEVKTWDVTLLDGSEYRRLIAEDDQPLSEKKAAKEERKLRQSIDELRRETPKQRAKRLARIEEEREQERRFRREVTRAFDFTLSGEERIGEVDAWVIAAEPKPGYRPDPKLKRADLLRKLRGKLWIAKDDHGWVKVDLETTDSFSIGLFLLKLKEGTRIEFSQRRHNGEVWLMDAFHVRFRGRAGLVIGFNGEVSASYDNFRKFSADSRIVAVDAVN